MLTRHSRGAGRGRIPVVFGDATDPEVQADARCDRARHVFACAGSDATNLRILAACSKLAKDPGWLPGTAHVFIESDRLWRDLTTAPLITDTGGKLRVDFVNVPDLAGRALAGPDPNAWLQGHSSAHIVAFAGSAIGRSAIAHVVRLLLLRRITAALTIIGEDANHDRAGVLAYAPWVERCVMIEALAFEPSTAPVSSPPPFGPMTAGSYCRQRQRLGPRHRPSACEADIGRRGADRGPRGR